MNKASLVLGIAAAAALTGCMDPEWARRHNKPQVEPEPSPTYQDNTRPSGPVTPVRPGPTEIAAVPGDMPPVIEETTIPDVLGADRPGPRPPAYPGVTPPPSATDVTPAPAAESTTYVVQPGDTLSKLSKRTNIKIDAIKKANPQIKGNTLIVGQKLTFPGKVEIEPPKAVEPPAPPKPYTGPTSVYTVKPGDTLGGIARAHKTTVAQVKAMNNMKSDIVVVGRKLTVPGAAAATAAAPAKAASAKAAAVKAPAKAADKKTPPAKADEKKVETPAKADEKAGEDKKPAAEEPAPAPEQNQAAATGETPPPASPAAGGENYIIYTVKDGEDITGISIEHDISPSEIRQLNKLPPDAQVTAGMQLKLPASTL